jgi:hypothetical protein
LRGLALTPLSAAALNQNMRSPIAAQRHRAPVAKRQRARAMHPNSESQEPGRFARQLFVQSRTPLPTWPQSILGSTSHRLWFSSSVPGEETGRVVGCYGLCLSDQRDPGPAPQMSRRLSMRRAPGSPLVAPASTSKLRTLVTGLSLSRCEDLLRLKSMYSP